MMTLGAQLYTLRSYTQNEEDLAYCLKKVAEIGYTTVQISAVGPHPGRNHPGTLRQKQPKNRSYTYGCEPHSARYRCGNSGA